MIYKEIEGVGSVTLMTRVTGFGELQSKMSDRDLCSSFVMELACLSVFILSDSIDSGGLMVSPGGDPIFGSF